MMASASAVNVALTLLFIYPDAKLGPSDVLTVRGNFSTLSWSSGIVASHVDSNTWSATLPIPAAQACDSLQYKALVNDAYWQVGANEQATLAACRSASGAHAVRSYPWFGSQAGRYEYVRDVYSSGLNNSRDLVVYLPPSYDENSLKPFATGDVLLMHDGQNLFNASTSAFGVAWMCQDTLNDPILQGGMREVIVVGVDNTPARIFEYTYSVDPTVGQGGGADLYLDFLRDTVLPVVAGRYRVFPTPGARWGVLGSSLGGLLSCYAGWTRPSEYAFTGCMSSSFWWNNEDFNNSVIPSAPPPHVGMYLDSGDAGPDNDDVNQTQTVRDSMLSLGFPYSPIVPQCGAGAPSSCLRTLAYYLDHGGQHGEAYWGARFYVPMLYAYPPTVRMASVG